MRHLYRYIRQIKAIYPLNNSWLQVFKKQPANPAFKREGSLSRAKKCYPFYMDIVLKYIRLSILSASLFMIAVACGTAGYKVPVDEETKGHKNVRAGGRPAASAPKKKILGIHSPAGWPQRPIEKWFGSSLTNSQKKAILEAASIWSAATREPLFKNGSTHDAIGDDFIDLYSSLNDSITATYIDSDWDKTGKPNRTLGTTIWINNQDGSGITHADIRLNGQVYAFGDTDTMEEEDKPIVDLVTLALHEMGHLLGLSHVSEEEDPYSIMNPTMFIGRGMHARILSEGDIKRIQSIYGGPLKDPP